MISVKLRPRVVIFAGAGASKAVSPDQYPATREFFERLPKRVLNNNHFQMVCNHLKATTPDAVVDIEMVLWELQNLLSFFEVVLDQRNIVFRAVNDNILRQVHPNWGFGQLRDGAANVQQALKNVIGWINEQVYDFYSYEPDASELADNWIKLLKGLIDAEARVDIFTTNYDLVVESALNEIGGEKLLNTYIGAGGKLQRYIELSNWQEESKGDSGLLTKLHGSLNWKRKENSIFIGDSIFTGSHEKQAIIYPGFKGLSDEPFFAPFHDYLSRMLADADHLLVIGFAFRDENIRQIFQNSLPRRIKLTQLDPAEDVKLPTRRKVNRLDYFDRSSVETFLETVTE